MNQKIDDRALVERIAHAYKLSTENDSGSSEFEWIAIPNNKNDQFTRLLQTGKIEILQELLRDPGKTDLFYGFDNLSAGIELSNDSKIWLPVQAKDLLLRLCHAIGAHPLPNKEFQKTNAHSIDIEEIIKTLDDHFQIAVDFPNPFSGEIGAETSRGIASYRAIQALYQAWRISRLCEGISSPRVVEIGAGLGRTGYYAWKMGIRNYMIVDIAMTEVAQSYFLGRVLGDDCIRLNGEEKGPGICIFPPSAFLKSTENYDLVLNVDSWTEMPQETARQYMRSAEQRSSMIWSVNHEANAFTVRELFGEASAKRVVRSPYWMRDSYVDELVDMRKDREILQLQEEFNSWHATRKRFVSLTIDRLLHRMKLS